VGAQRSGAATGFFEPGFLVGLGAFFLVGFLVGAAVATTKRILKIAKIRSCIAFLLFCVYVTSLGLKNYDNGMKRLG